MAENAVWSPSREYLEHSNLAELMRRTGSPTYDALLEFAVANPERFWRASLEHLGIEFERPWTKFVDVSAGKEWAKFFDGGHFNFARACLRPPKGPAGARQPAVIWENEAGRQQSLSYEELAERTLRATAGLRRLGVRRGDRVGLLMPNVPEAVIAFLAVGCLGAIIVPLYSGFGYDAAATRLQDAGASCLIAADGFIRRGKRVDLAGTAGALLNGVETLQHLAVVSVLGDATLTCAHTPWAEIEAENAESGPPADTAAADPCMVIYTSGTTGKPKGTVHVHGGFPLRVSQDAAYLFDFHAADRLFWMSDMGWMVGPFSIIASLMLKGTLVLYDGAPDRPSFGRLRDIAGRHKVTHFGASPTAIRALASNEADALAPDADSLRILITAGEIIDGGAFHWYHQRFGAGRLPVINYTGGTEVSGAILSNCVMRPIRPSAFNSVAPGMSAGVIDSDGHRVAGMPGELAIFEPFVGMTAGFWNAPDRYIESYWSRVPGIWVHGDLAMEEEDGQITLLGRSDDVLKIAGKRIGPSEIEAIVVDGQSIDEALAFGVPDQTQGEAIVLMIVPKEGTEAAGLEERTSDLLKTRLGKAFAPKAVVAVQRLPKTRNGKTVRRLARSAWLGEQPGNVDGIEDPGVFVEVSRLAAARKSRLEDQR